MDLGFQIKSRAEEGDNPVNKVIAAGLLGGIVWFNAKRTNGKRIGQSDKFKRNSEIRDRRTLKIYELTTSTVPFDHGQ